MTETRGRVVVTSFVFGLEGYHVVNVIYVHSAETDRVQGPVRGRRVWQGRGYMDSRQQFINLARLLARLRYIAL